MTDEQLPGPTGADEATPTPEPTVDYEKRWKDTHANWNTLNEQMSRFKQDPNAVLEFIRDTHPDLLADEEADDEPDYQDEPAAPAADPRIDWLTAREADRQYEADLKDALGNETVPGKAKDWIRNRTAALGNDKKALEKAVEEFREFAGEIRGPQRKDVPAPPPPGTAGEKKYDPRNKEERRARMAASIEAARQQ